jgi:hypothetical protein
MIQDMGSACSSSQINKPQNFEYMATLSLLVERYKELILVSWLGAGSFNGPNRIGFETSLF